MSSENFRITRKGKMMPLKNMRSIDHITKVYVTPSTTTSQTVEKVSAQVKKPVRQLPPPQRLSKLESTWMTPTTMTTTAVSTETVNETTFHHTTTPAAYSTNQYGSNTSNQTPSSIFAPSPSFLIAPLEPASRNNSNIIPKLRGASNQKRSIEKKDPVTVEWQSGGGPPPAKLRLSDYFSLGRQHQPMQLLNYHQKKLSSGEASGGSGGGSRGFSESNGHSRGFNSSTQSNRPSKLLRDVPRSSPFFSIRERNQSQELLVTSQPPELPLQKKAAAITEKETNLEEMFQESRGNKNLSLQRQQLLKYDQCFGGKNKENNNNNLVAAEQLATKEQLIKEEEENENEDNEEETAFKLLSKTEGFGQWRGEKNSESMKGKAGEDIFEAKDISVIQEATSSTHPQKAVTPHADWFVLLDQFDLQEHVLKRSDGLSSTNSSSNKFTSHKQPFLPPTKQGKYRGSLMLPNNNEQNENRQIRGLTAGITGFDLRGTSGNGTRSVVPQSLDRNQAQLQDILDLKRRLKQQGNGIKSYRF